MKIHHARNLRTALLRLIAWIIMLVCLAAPAAGKAFGQSSVRVFGNDTWVTHTSGNYINEMAREGNILWAATRGGLVKWDLTSGSYTKILPTPGGLAGLNVSSVLIDSLGNKWFGTDSGLSKFDGVNWTTFTTSDGLSSNAINDLALDGGGNLWLATSNGVSKFNGSTWTIYRTANGLVNNTVYAVAADGSTLWFGTYEKVSKFDGTTWTTYTIGNGYWSLNMINDIAVDPGVGVWFASGNNMGSSGGGPGGITYFDGTNWTTYTTANSGLPSSYGFAVAVGGAGVLWAGTEGGASLYASGVWTSYNAASQLVHPWVTAILVDGSTTWLGTNGGGISRFDGSTWTSYQTADGLPHNSILAMRANQNDVWFSTGDLYVLNSTSSGLVKYNGTSWTFYPFGQAGLNIFEASALAVDANGLLWVGGPANKLVSGTGAAWTTFTDPYLSGAKARAIAIDGNDKWIAMYQPFGNPAAKWVSKFNGSAWNAYTTQNSGLISDSVNAIAVDQDHSVWFGTPSGVSAFNGTTWTSYTTADGLISNNVSSVAVDLSNNLWFGTNAGVSKFDGAIWTNYTAGNGLVSNTVRSIAVDPYGILWFSTSGGVSSYDGANWKNFTKSNSGLLTNSVYGVTVTAAGHKWFSHGTGLSELYSVPTLTSNYSTGAPGSYFNVTGAGYPPNRTANIWSNGVLLGTALTNAEGAFTITLSSDQASSGFYRILASVNPSAECKIVIDSASPVRAQEGTLTPLAISPGTAFQAEVFLPAIRR
jgi:ligand-binding sensor domain-containing protein